MTYLTCCLGFFRQVMFAGASHLCWARSCSMTRFPCLFVWVFWQMMFASARICAGQEISYDMFSWFFPVLVSH